MKNVYLFLTIGQRTVNLLSFIFLFVCLQSPIVLFAQSHHTVSFSGSTGDFNSVEKYGAGNDVDYYVTYDASYIYFGAFRTNSNTWGQYDHFTIYVDSDPTSSVSSGGNGTTTGINWDSNTPTLPIQADYRIAIRRNGSGESFYSTYSGSWSTGSANGQGWTQYTTSSSNGALEVRVPWSDLGSPDAIYFTMYCSYNGGFFAPAPGSFSGSTLSGYFGGIGTTSTDCLPLNISNTAITASISNTAPSSGATYGRVIVSSGTITNANNFSIAPGGSISVSGGTFTIGAQTVTMGGGTSGDGRGTTINTSGSGTLSTSSSTVFNFNGEGTVTGNNLSLNATVQIRKKFTPLASGALTFASGSALDVRSGGYVNTNAPTYASGSYLMYNSGNTYTTGTEWTPNAASGAGVPYNVTIGNNIASSVCSFGSSSQYRQANGTLLISNATAGAGLTLSSSSGGDIRLAGDFNKQGGTFSCNSRAVNFYGSANQSWVSDATETIHYLSNYNTGGTVSINSSLNIGNSFTNSASASLSQTSGTLTFNSGSSFSNSGTLTVNSGATAIANAALSMNTAGSSNVINGTLRANDVAITGTTSRLSFGATGTYEHNYTSSNGAFPSATWNASSTCIVMGMTSPATAWPTNSSGQTFGNFTWNTPSLSTSPVLLNDLDIAGSFTLTSTGSSSFRITAGATRNINCLNFVMAAGTLDFASGAGNGILNCTGTFNQTGGTLTETSSGSGTINLIKASGSQNLTASGTVSNTIVWNIGNGTSTNTVALQANMALGSTQNPAFYVKNNAALDFATYVLSGSAGLFTPETGSTLLSANTSASGAINSSGANGSVQTGKRSFTQTGVHYTFNAAAAQKTGTAIGKSGDIGNLTVNVASGLTLDTLCSLSGTLSLSNGILQLGNQHLTITNSASGAISGANSSRFIRTNGTGELRRAIASSGLPLTYLFPIGSSGDYTPASFTFTTNSTARTLYLRAVTPRNGNDGTATDFIDNRWWRTDLSLASGTYDYTSQFTFLAGDVVGTLANIRLSRYNTSWNMPAGSSASGTTLSSGSLDESNGPLVDGSDASQWVGRVTPVSTNYTWNGSSSSDWGTATNWTPNGIPGTIDNVTINVPGTNTLNITSNRTIQNFTINGTGTFQMAASTDLTITGTASYGGTASVSLNCSSTIYFTSASNVTIPPLNYGNLNASGGDRTFYSSGTIGICGTFTPGAGAYTVTGSTVDFNSAGAQTIPGCTYNNLSNSNNGNRTLSGTIHIAGTYSPTSGTVSPGTSTVNFSNSSAQTIPASMYYNITNTGNGNRTLASSGTISLANTFTPGTGTYTVTGSTVEYTAASGTISLPQFTYNNLTFNSSGSGTFAPASGVNLIVNNNFNIGSAATSSTFNLASNSGSSNTLTVSGDITLQNGGILQLITNSGASGATLNVSGNLTVSGNGRIDFETVSSTSGDAVIQLDGNFNSSGSATASAGDNGIVDFGTGTNTGNYFYIKGNFSHSGTGNFGTQGGTQAGGFSFNKAGTQTFSYTGATVSSKLAYTVNSGATLQMLSNLELGTGSAPDTRFSVNGVLEMGNKTIIAGNTSDPDFFLNSGARLKISEATGMTANFSGFGASRMTFDNNSTVEYNGTNPNTGFPAVLSSIGGIEWLGSGNITLNQSVSVLGAFAFTNNGHFLLGNNTLTLAIPSSLSGAPFSASKMFVTNGTGYLKQNFTTPSNVTATWHIGEITGTAEYSPVTLTFTAGPVNGGISFRVIDAVHPGMGASANYASRYWNTGSTFGTYSWTGTFTYSASDIVGAQSNFKCDLWDPVLSGWNEYANSSASSNVLTVSSPGNPGNGTLNNWDVCPRLDVPEYYRSVASGPNSWNSASSWEVSSDPLFVSPAPVAASYVPNAANSSGITIRNGHTINLASDITGDDILIESGATLTLGAVLTLNNGIAATDLTITGTLNSQTGGGLIRSVNSNINVSGTLKVSGSSASVSGTGTTTFTGTATYEHGINGGTVPSATWNSGSLCLINGMTSSPPGGLGQPFHHFTWNCSGQTAHAGLAATLAFSGSGTIYGDFEVVNTNGYELRLTASSSYIGVIWGDINVRSNGILVLTNASSAFTPNNNCSLTGNSDLTVEGKFTVAGTNANAGQAPSVSIVGDIYLPMGIANPLLVSAGASAASLSGKSLYHTGNGEAVIANSSGNASLSLSDAFSLTGSGTFKLTNSSGNGTLMVAKNFTHSAGTLSRASTGTANVEFNGTTAQTYTSGGTVSGDVNFLVKTNAILDMNTSFISGSGTFTTQNSSTLRLGSADGIVALSVTNGNIRNSGSRTFASAATYTYNGLVNQQTGSGLPASISGSLVINNTGNTVSLTNDGTSVGTLNLQAGTFSIGTGQTLNILNAGTVSISSGAFPSGSTAGTLNFNGNGSFSGTSSPYNVYASGGVNFGVATTIQTGGTFRINAGGYVDAANPPTYASGASLQYNTGGTYGRYDEWKSTSGAGYPYHVQLSNNTTLNLGNGGTGTARQIAGNLLIDDGSTLSMNISGAEMTAALTVNGDVTIGNSGTASLVLSSAIGGDLFVKGNFSRNASSLLSANSRRVSFNGSTAQQITGATTFDYFTLNNSAGLTLNNAIQINNELDLSNGKMTIGNNQVSLNGSATIVNASSSSYLITNGTGSLSRQVNNGGGAVQFPVGTSSDFANVGLTQGGTSDNLSVRVKSAPAFDYAVNDNSQMLNLQWVLNENVAGGNALSTNFQWPVSVEAGSFNRSNPVFQADYTGSAYQARPSTVSGSNPYNSASSTNFSGNLSNRIFVLGNINGIFPCLATNAGGGDWQTVGTWVNGVVPPAGASVCINSAVTVTSTDPQTLENLTINSGGSLNISSGRVVTISSSGTLNNNSGAAQNLGNGTVFFAGAGSISGGQAFTMNHLHIDGATTITTTPTINGNLKLGASGSISTGSINYGSSSTLVYDGGTRNTGNEWTGNAASAGVGVPGGLTIQNTTALSLPTSNRGIAGNLNINSGSLNLNTSSGDLYLTGNFNRVSTATFNPNNRAVFFNGATTQTIEVSGGTSELFNYLFVQKTSGNLQLNDDVEVSASSGNVLSVNNTASIDLNGKTLTLSGTGGNLATSGGLVQIIGSAGSTLLVSNGTKTVTQSAGGSLSTGTNVTVRLQNGFDFGNNLSTINGTLLINAGGFVSGNAANYASGSVIKYATGNSYGRGLEWSATSGAGYPYHVEIEQNGTNTTLDLSNGGSALRKTAGNLTIHNGAGLTMNAMTNALEVAGNVLIGDGASGSLTLSSSIGGDLLVGGNLTRNSGATFTQNSRSVTMNGALNQTITGVSTFDYLCINNSGTAPNNVVSIATNTGINNRLTLSNGTFDIGAYTLTMANASQIRRQSATASMTAAPTLGGADMYDLRYDASMTNGVEFLSAGNRVRNLEIASGTLSLSGNKTVNLDLKLAGDLDLGGNTLVLYGNNSSPAVAGNLEITSGARSITGSAGSILDIRGTFANNPTWFTKTVTNPGSGTLTCAPNVTVRIGDGRMDFGTGSPVTINGVLQVMLGGSVYPNPCYYGTASTLRFANTVDYVVPSSDLTWAAGAISSGNPGIPWNVEVSDVGTDLQLNDTRALRGNLTINNGSFTLSSGYTGSFNIGGNWSRSGASSNFVHNNKKVVFDKQVAGNQSISVGSGVTTETYYKLEVSCLSGNELALGSSTNVTVNDTLHFDTGKLNIGASGNVLTIGTTSSDGAISGAGSSKYVISSGGFLKRFSGSNAAYAFPVGDASNYTPSTITLSSGGQSGAFINVLVAAGKNSKLGSTTVYLNRYWTVEPSGLGASPVYAIDYTYASGELLGGGSAYYPIKYKETGAPAEQGWCTSTGAPANPLSPPFSRCTTGTSYSHGGTTFTWNGLTTFSDFTAAGDYGPLPVTLLEFGATLTSTDAVRCSWTTASEINNNYFVVERSFDAIHFEKIGQVKGSGNSTQVREYSFTDANPYSGVSYYRLVQVDYNGQSETFDPAVINNQNTTFSQVRIYPNPGNSPAQLWFIGNENADGIIQLIDLSGRQVLTRKFAIQQGLQTVLLDLSGHQAGQYLITVSDSKGRKRYLPFIYTGQ